MDPQTPDTAIAPLTAQHISEVMAIEMQSFGKFAWTRKTSFTKYARNAQGFVLVDNKTRVIGFALLTETREKVVLDKMAISEKHRGHGLGKLLLSWILSRCRSRDAPLIVLHVRGSNAPAINIV